VDILVTDRIASWAHRIFKFSVAGGVIHDNADASSFTDIFFGSLDGIDLHEGRLPMVHLVVRIHLCEDVRSLVEVKAEFMTLS